MVWEDPLSAQDLFLRLIQANGVIPSLHDRHIVHGLGIAAKVNRKGAICVRLGRPIIDYVNLLVVGYDKAFLVVYGDRSEPIDWNFGKSQNIR